MSTEVVMPQMGESIAEGTITKWLKKVGDRVERDEPLFEISTDKVDAEIPSPAAGTLTEIRFNEGDTVEVNTTVAVLDGGAAGSARCCSHRKTRSPAPSSGNEAGAEACGNRASRPAPPANVDLPPPETQPAVQQAEAPRNRRAAKPPEPSPNTEPKPRRPKSAPAAGNGSSATATAEELRRTKSSPLVRKIAQEHGVDIAKLEGTGMSGRVTKNDILSFIESGAPVGDAAAALATRAALHRCRQAPAAPPLKPGEGDRVEQMTVMRKKIAEHMVQSRRTSAHVTTVYEIDMTRIAKLRDQHKEEFNERTGTKLTFMPFIFQAVN